MREWLLASDKLNAVITVLLLIWGGIVAHLWHLTRKVSKLEKVLSDASHPSFKKEGQD